VLFCFAREAAGATVHPAFPAPSSSRDVVFVKTRARSVPREGEGVRFLMLFERLNDKGPSWPGIAVRRTASLPLAYARPSTSLIRDYIVKIVPIRIVGDNQSNLPGTRPMLDIMLALDRISDAIKGLEVNEPLQPIASRKAFNEPRTMLKDATHKVTSAVNLKFLSVLLQAHHRNFKFKNRATNINLLVLL
jgi:hypothetical protein